MKYIKLSTVLIAIILTCTNAYAVDFSTPIKNIKGEEIHQCRDKPENMSLSDFNKECKEQPILTLKDVAVNSLAYEYPDEQTNVRENKTGLNPTDKIKRIALSINIEDSKNGKVDLSSEQTTMLKNLIAKLYPGTIVYRAWEILDPESVKNK